MDGLRDADTLLSSHAAVDVNRRGHCWTSYDTLRVVAGVLFLTAATFKAYQLATGPLNETDILTTRWFLIVVVEWEIAMGLALVVGLYQEPVRQIAIITFSIFIAVALYRGVTGDDSCGCFGSMPVNPWLVLAMDVVATAFFWKLRPRRNVAQEPPLAESRSGTWRVALFCSAFVASGIPTALAMNNGGPSALLADGERLGVSSLVVLDPNQWIGRQFPLQGHIDIGESLTSGRWTIVLHHHDCRKCRALIAKIEEAARESAGADHTNRVALIEMPPFDDVNTQRADASTRVLARGRLTADRDWFAHTPAVIQLDEGIVAGTSSDSEWSQ
ncbi:MAG TPA: MauE/DoxX family redox-associated membrane protein [Pirellulales bacterium]|jgi:uncharacterized membrane protein YphA (DoxX/SURF4 family)